jgi:hypothetical protein
MSREMSNDQSCKRVAGEELEASRSKRARVEDEESEDGYAEEAAMFEEAQGSGFEEATVEDSSADKDHGEIVIDAWMSITDMVNATIYNMKRRKLYEEETMEDMGIAKKQKVTHVWTESDINDWCTVDLHTGTFHTGTYPVGTEPSIAPPGFNVPVPEELLDDESLGEDVPEPVQPNVPKPVQPIVPESVEQSQVEPVQLIIPEPVEKSQAEPVQPVVPEPVVLPVSLFSRMGNIQEPAALAPVRSIFDDAPPPAKVTFFGPISETDLQGLRDEDDEEMKESRSLFARTGPKPAAANVQEPAGSLFARMGPKPAATNVQEPAGLLFARMGPKLLNGTRNNEDDTYPIDTDMQDDYYDYGKDEPTYDPNFVAKEFSDEALKKKHKIKIPDYKPKPPGYREERDRQDRQRAEEEMAWKTLNREMGNRVTSAATDEYKTWINDCKIFFGNDIQARAKHSMSVDRVPFPKIPARFCLVSSRDCVRGEKLNICQHDVLRVLKGLGKQNEGEEWLERLKRERTRWHPDNVNRKMGKNWEVEAREMFQMLQALTERETR